MWKNIRVCSQEFSGLIFVKNLGNDFFLVFFRISKE